MDAQRVYLTKTDRSKGVICDQAIRLNGFYVSRDYFRTSATHPMQRSRVGQDTGISDQQLDTTSIDHYRAAEEPPPSGAVLQIAQATSAHQAFFGHEQKRGEDAYRVRCAHLRANCHRQKGAPPQCLSLHFIADIVSLDFRENPYFIGLAT